MATRDLTIEILKSIRDEAVKTNARLDQTNERLDSMREELTERIDSVGSRISASELRTSTAIADLAGTVREMTAVLRASSDLRPRVERCEHDIADLQRRVG